MATQSRPHVPETMLGQVSRDPSYVDRARIDSDVRAFLRPASTPWIVFDRDSKVDDFAKSALRVGAVFASQPSYRPEVIEAAQMSGRTLAEIAAAPLPELQRPVSITETGDAFRVGGTLTPARSSVLANVFPSEVTTEPPVEPSNLVVATDVLADAPSSSNEIAFAPPRRLATIAGVAAAALVVGFVLTFAGRGHLHRSSASAAAARATVMKTETKTETAPTPAPAPELPPVIELTEPSAAATPAPAPAAKPEAPSTSEKRFGKLTLKGDATRRVVWFDGKRMLGTGQRSFTVYCGMHTVAVSDKADSKDIEIPCNGEYVVSK